MATLTELAARLGVGKGTVSKAIAGKRITKGIVFDTQGRFLSVSDIEAAAEEYWATARKPATPGDPAASPADDGMMTGPVRLKHFQALRAEAEFYETAGELVQVSEVYDERADDYAEVRSRLMALPSRAKQLDPTLTLEQLDLFESLLREACDALADEGDQPDPEPTPPA